VGKKVVVIAAGLTERRAIPHLTRHLIGDQISVSEVRIPASNGALTPERARQIIKAAWYESLGSPLQPEKFVVLIDADGRQSLDQVQRFEETCCHLGEIKVPCLIVVAQWHLEAWFFAHAEALREFLGRDTGNIDTSTPDSIINPKLHLKHILAEPYTAGVAEEIAKRLSPDIIRQRSPSFASFETALRNGEKPQ
jgi:hypothetical protein